MQSEAIGEELLKIDRRGHVLVKAERKRCAEHLYPSWMKPGRMGACIAKRFEVSVTPSTSIQAG